MKCPNCGTETAGEEFCPNCGTGLPQGERRRTTWEIIWRTILGALAFIASVVFGLGGTCLVLIGGGSLGSATEWITIGLMLLGGLLAVAAAVFLFRWALALWK